MEKDIRESDASETDTASEDRVVYSDSRGDRDIEKSGSLPAPHTTEAVPTPMISDPSSEPSSSTDPDPAPDGGLQAWLQVLGSVVILANTWGLINTFGVYQAYYETDLLKSNTSSEISWIGSIQASLLLLVGVISGPLFDAGYFRHLLITGLTLIVFGQFMTSLCTQYWQVLLAQGFCIGIGMGLTFLPSAAIVSQYFTKHRALAIGISSAGSPVAGIIFPVIFSRLEPTLGFGWATRVIAFVLLAISIVPVLFMRTRLPPSGRARAFIDKSALRDWPFAGFVIAGFFGFMTLYVPFFYITLFATSHGITTPDFAPYLVTFLNLGSVFGRVVPNAIADRLGSLNVLVACTFASAVTAFGWFGIHDLGGSVVFALLYGAFSGAVVSLTPSVVASMTPDMSRLGTRLGMSFMFTGVSILIGTPIAGSILGDFTQAEWQGTMGYGAAGLFIAAVFYSVSRALLYKRNRRWRD
ncbi:major facilitator superfamily domain-containing protein [Bombardia bombarda]|uniref:Major facilitator superfamily domain-containing protein n=1 Tax=Bombardia bombarda TaxID=252184 RepID=A0AA40C416_9PEZI|nr:major facilitator superfamily domain-containing protein [Bombardia bombarda]